MDRDDTVNRPFDEHDLSSFAAGADAHRRPPETVVALCPDCGEALTVEGDGDGMGDPVHLFCDYCPNVEHAADLTPDWNGETGNHLSCESAAR